MTKILVTGSAGLVGSQLINELVEQNFDVYSSYHLEKPVNGKPIQLDLADKKQITNTIQTIKPDVVIHLAAITDVDICETKQDVASEINTKVTEIIAKECSKSDIFLVYVSTDYVFDGKTGRYKEKDETNPVGFYGKSKLEGEKAVRNFASSWCIARTSTPFGLHSSRKSFPTWVIENILQKKSINVLTDQYTSPTYVPNLCKMLIEIAKRKITGIIHVSGESRISRYDLACIIVEKLNLDKAFLKPISINEIKWNAKRPIDSSLDVSLASKILTEKPMNIQQSLELFLKQL